MAEKHRSKKPALKEEAIGGVIRHLTMSLDVSIANPGGAMYQVLEYPEPNASVEVIEKTGPVLEKRSSASSECWQLDSGFTAHHRRAIAPDVGGHG